jgi:23S rRNA pseudouridine2605 synthase
LRSAQKNTWLEIVLDEGRNRQIRRMLEAFDLRMLRLVRVGVGTLPLGELAEGPLAHAHRAGNRIAMSPAQERAR